jgi:cytosolic carboxypeptidase protein 5
MTYEREELIPGLFPNHPVNKEGGTTGGVERAFKFDKQTVFLTCRVHPGETPGQFVLNGIYKFLLDYETNPQSKLLLNLFVFKIIPVLNPDGVYRGYYRMDTLNQNLNRYYLEPTMVEQPTILAAKQAIV